MVLHGKPTRIQEGDLLVSFSRNVISYLIALVNGGYSHVMTAVSVNGNMFAIGVLERSWTDASGVAHPPGVTCEALELCNDPIYARLWLVRPRVARTTEQTMRLRLTVADHLRRKAGEPEAYDSAREFVHTFCGWMPATTDKHHCSELAACLAKASGDGAWPEGQTTSVPIHRLVAMVGEPENIF